MSEIKDSPFYKRYRERIKKAKTDDELNIIIGEIYTDGFTDGEDESYTSEDREPAFDWNDLD